MRAEEVIATHGNTDFDAFAAMLAARRLYPGAVVAVGALNRNVREFYRLHAEELGAGSPRARRDPSLGRHRDHECLAPRRAGAHALDPAVEDPLRSPRRRRVPEWIDPAAAVLSTDGALTTTLVGILAEREILPTPLEATTFALGIHEDTGSLTYATSTQRDADALSWCLRHGRARISSRRTCTPLSAGERDLLNHLLEALEPIGTGGEELLLAAVRWPKYVDGISNLAHKIVDLTDTKALVLLVEMEERVFAVVRSRSDLVDASAVAAALGGGGHAQAASAILRADLDEARRSVISALEHAPQNPPRPRCHVDASTVGRPEHSVRDAMALSAPRTERSVRHRERPRRRVGESRGSRQGDRPRARARAGAGSHEWACARRPRTRRSRSCACSSRTPRTDAWL